MAWKDEQVGRVGGNSRYRDKMASRVCVCMCVYMLSCMCVLGWSSECTVKVIRSTLNQSQYKVTVEPVFMAPLMWVRLQVTLLRPQSQDMLSSPLSQSQESSVTSSILGRVGAFGPVEHPEFPEWTQRGF